MTQLDLAFVERAYDNRLDPVAAFSDDLRLRYWNPPMETLSAVPRERAVGAGLFDLFPNERDGRAAKLVRAALSGDGVFSEPPFFAARDPARAHEYEWMVAPLLHQGNVNGAVLVARSSLARGGIEHRLAETEQRFRAMADSSPVLLWMSGRDALCNFFNSTWLAFSGRTLDQELGVGWSEGIYPEDFERCMTTYTRAFSAREAFEMEYRLRRHDGEYRWILDRGAPRFTPAGEFAGFIGSCVDITDRIRAEQETRELADDLQRANSYMEQLLYATSHDLREPIRMVLAFLDRLDQRLGEGLDREARTSVRFAREGATRMRAVVDGLVEFARARQIRRVTTEIDVDALVRGVVEELSPAIEQTRGQIEIEPMPHLQGDRLQLHRVFQNLLSNALKFHGENPPSVRVSAERQGDEWIFCVADQGIGFEPEYGEKIFGIFQRLHSQDRFPGAGIGLAIAKDIVERHGGRIWARSRLGEGARFYFSLEGSRAGAGSAD